MAQSEKMKQTLDKLEAGVIEFFTSEKYITYLQVMSKFHTYSANNQVLIAMQMPDATAVAGYNSWIRNFDRHVKRGEKSITILAPMKVKIKIDTDRRDADGKIIQEERETIKFRPVSVFDVSQTEGKPLPEIITELTGDVSRYEQLLYAARQAAPYPIEIGAVEGSAKGWCNFTQEKIIIKEGMSEAQTLKTAFHETAHARIHSKQGISVHCINTMPQIPLVGVFPNPPEKNNTKCSCRCSIGTMNKKFTLNCVK